MDQIVEFAGNHWMLFSLFFVLTAMLLNTFASGGIKTLQPMEAVRMINQQDAVVLDVRMDNEFKEGHIINSVHIPLGNLESRMSDLNKFKEKPIIVSCRSGNRSARACGVLSKQGFPTVYNLSGGIMAWQNANLPLERR